MPTALGSRVSEFTAAEPKALLVAGQNGKCIHGGVHPLKASASGRPPRHIGAERTTRTRTQLASDPASEMECPEVQSARDSQAARSGSTGTGNKGGIEHAERASATSAGQAAMSLVHNSGLKVRGGGRVPCCSGQL